MTQLLIKIKNAFRKEFRIVKNDWHIVCPHPLLYKIEQRYTIFFFIHWWGTPSFAPPHLFENDCDAMRCIKRYCPNAIVYDYYSENKCKK